MWKIIKKHFQNPILEGKMGEILAKKKRNALTETKHKKCYKTKVSSVKSVTLLIVDGWQNKFC